MWFPSAQVVNDKPAPSGLNSELMCVKRQLMGDVVEVTMALSYELVGAVVENSQRMPTRNYGEVDGWVKFNLVG